MTDPATIAKGLSEARRIAMLLGIEIAARHWPWTTSLLIADGLLSYRRKWWLFGPKIVVLTRKGLAVRRALQEQEHG